MKLKLKIHLPSIGGSPTRDDACFKCPLPVKCGNLADNILHSSSNINAKDDKVRAGRSFNDRPPSTPTGFWDLELEQRNSNDNDDEKENNKDVGKNDVENASPYISRRRRRYPLIFRSIQADM
ncbi:unnamed protein product [Trichobilharzia szidati]|nr:unnamed protein product [Trichobilharzia szidati]